MKLISPHELWSIRACDTHCHHLTEEFFSSVSLYNLMQMTYVSWILPSQGDTPEGRKKYFELMGANSYFYWWKRGVEALYGEGETLTPESWDRFDTRIKNAYKIPFHDIEILKNACLYDDILLDDYKCPGSDHTHPEIMRPIYRTDMFLQGYKKGVTDENGNDAYEQFENEPTSLDEYVIETEKAISRAAARGAVGLKTAIAYERSLEFEKDGRLLAERAFQNGCAAKEEIKGFGDFMMFEIAKIAARLNVPVQIHTGLGALSGSRAIGLRDLIHMNPETKFDIFHASYPWCEDVLGLAHNYKNVYVDICWLPLISAEKAASFLKEALELIDSGRIIWGCDTWTSEESMGARLAAHEVIADAVNCFIEKGRISYELGMDIAEKILRTNAKRLFGLM
ncbi:MAG: amidohydrolase family protein [Clostridia bacterium]|nr:amidohydrolase family protein [Clostridia bacterium]